MWCSSVTGLVTRLVAAMVLSVALFLRACAMQENGAECAAPTVTIARAPYFEVIYGVMCNNFYTFVLLLAVGSVSLLCRAQQVFGWDGMCWLSLFSANNNTSSGVGVLFCFNCGQTNAR